MTTNSTTGTKTEGPRDRSGALICKGDRVTSCHSKSNLGFGAIGLVTSIARSAGYKGATVWSIGIDPQDNRSSFRTTTPEIHVVA